MIRWKSRLGSGPRKQMLLVSHSCSQALLLYPSPIRVSLKALSGGCSALTHSRWKVHGSPDQPTTDGWWSINAPTLELLESS